MSEFTAASVAEDTRIWLEKAVIGLNLCPFAKAVYVKNLLRIRVVEARHLDAFLEALDEELERLKTTPETQLATTLLVCPTLFHDFEVFNDMLDLADAAVAEHGLEGIVQIAPFHPYFRFEDTEETDVGNATNRSPWPTLHLIREADIERAVADEQESRDIFERNIRLLQHMGQAGWAALGLPEGMTRPHEKIK